METADMVATGTVSKGGSESSGITLTGVARDEGDRNPIFEALVSSEGEISGLVAYSLYKQNKRDWLEDFKKLVGRLPTDAETRSYIIGESTTRRLETYRQLAQTTLSEKGGRGLSFPSARKASALAAPLWALAIIIALGIVGYGLHVTGVIGAR